MARPASASSEPAGAGRVAPPVESASGKRSGVTWRDLVLLGVSGGMVPCPSALVVLLTSVAFNIVHIGLLLIAAFSLGLAIVLVGIGVFMVLAGKATAKLGVGKGGWVRILPKISGTAVTVVGISIVLKALDIFGVFDLGAFLGL
jgi:ABC-type nickel/cobalt efflux system permease component RcnA